MKPNIPKGKEPLKDKIDIGTMFDLNDTDLQDLHDRLWYEYFAPIRKLTKDEKDFIRRQLNEVAAWIKIEADGAKNPYWEVKLVEPSTTWELDEHGPSRKEVLYIEVDKRYTEVSSFKARSGKVNKEPNRGEIEEDLIGEDTKPLKRQADAAKARKYEETDDEEDLLGITTEGKITGIPKKPKVVSKPRDPNKVTATSIYPELEKLANKLGDNPDKISKAKPEWPRKCITDALWKWRKNKGGK